MLSCLFTGLLGGQGQDTTALCIKHRDLVVKRGGGRQPQRVGWAGLCASDILCPGTERDGSVVMLVLSCTLADAMKRTKM